MSTLSQVFTQFKSDAHLALPQNWRQGRTAYGGLSTALSLQAALDSVPEGLPPLRSAQVLFVGPASGDLGFRTQLLRRGKSVTSISVDCLSDDQIALRSAFVFGDLRESQINHEFSRMPEVGAPDRYTSVPALPMLPAFLSNFDVRFAGKSLPVSGSAHPELLAWVKHKDAQGVDPAVALLALADSLPAAAIVSFKEFAPLSSVTWTIDFASPAQPGEWFLLRSSSQRAAHGYSYQLMDIWNAQGEPVLAGSQTVAIFA
jgi:acyl-CoA thioesterase